ncbi:hypothetical protein [Streptomyces anthocyanicus]|uniref:hypothetical protein n=1 Tax=Streptomyces anthocyanicus TaxID=68174 RepID=UPI00381831EF
MTQTAAISTAVLALASGAFAFAPAAAATELPGINWDHTYSGTGVKVYVEEYGDVISVCDTSANGHSAWVWVGDSTNNIDHYKLTASSGKGSCATRRANDGSRYNLREYSRIALNFEGAGGRGSYYVSYVNDH